MKLYRQLLTENDCYRTGAALTPKGVMVHSTGADNPNLSRYVGPEDGRLGPVSSRNWNRPGVGACVHAFIGKLPDGSVAVYQTLPWTVRGWHAGGKANDTHLSFESCEDDLTDPDYFRAAYGQAVELTAFLCGRFGLDPLEPGVVICHSEGCRLGIASNHADVMHWFPRHGQTMEDFRRDVAAALAPKPQPEEDYARFCRLMERYRRELGGKAPALPVPFEEAKALSVTDGSRPGDLATREECAVMVRNALRRLEQT